MDFASDGSSTSSSEDHSNNGIEFDDLEFQLAAKKFEDKIGSMIVFQKALGGILPGLKPSRDKNLTALGTIQEMLGAPVNNVNVKKTEMKGKMDNERKQLESLGLIPQSPEKKPKVNLDGMFGKKSEIDATE